MLAEMNKMDLTLLKTYLLHAGKWTLTALLGWWMTIPDAILLLTGFVIADFATGLAAAFFQKKVDSSVGTRGGIKKCMIIALVFMLYKAELTMGLGLHIERWLSAYFITLEVVSIIKNCSRVGIPIPSVIVDALVKIKSIQPQSMSKAEVERAFHPQSCAARLAQCRARGICVDPDGCPIAEDCPVRLSIPVQPQA
jgi:toxin secretion/phage lysis holin